MRAALKWSAAVATSALVHAAMIGPILFATRPDPVEAMPSPDARINIQPHRVPQSEAAEREAPSAPGREAEAASARAGKQGIPMGRAEARVPAGQPSREAVPRADTLATTAPAAPSLQAEPPSGQTLATATPEATTAPPLATDATALTTLRPTAPAISASVAETTEALAGTLRPASLAASDALAAPLTAQSVAPPPAALQPATTPAQDPALPTAHRASLADPETPPRADSRPIAALPAPERAPPADVQVAGVAWSGGENARFDPASLAAIQSFTAQSDLLQSDADAGDARDAIQALFADVPCARLQAEYNPDTGTLDLRGHLPEDALRAPVLAALESRVGASIPVRDSTMLLPRPQCDMLTGIADVGLPQSTDQITNPRLVGDDTHVRLYSFRETDRLRLDVVAPDYPAFLYVDYFTSDGQVVHLMPNAYTPPVKRAPEEAVVVGDGALEIRIGPPFGQEIAVAMATSVDLGVDGRPIQETAGPYLDWLADRVAEARRTTPNFKGEWIYFMVSTSAR